MIVSVASCRSAAPIITGSFATAAAIRWAAVANTGYARPNGTPVIGSFPARKRFAIAGSVITVPDAMPAPPPRPARPVPSHRPGGFPVSV